MQLSFERQPNSAFLRRWNAANNRQVKPEYKALDSPNAHSPKKKRMVTSAHPDTISTVTATVVKRVGRTQNRDFLLRGISKLRNSKDKVALTVSLSGKEVITAVRGAFLKLGDSLLRIWLTKPNRSQLSEKYINRLLASSRPTVLGFKYFYKNCKAQIEHVLAAVRRITRSRDFMHSPAAFTKILTLMLLAKRTFRSRDCAAGRKTEALRLLKKRAIKLIKHDCWWMPYQCVRDIVCNQK
ncbi:hypothetical protein J6590_009031, partial [Homalodisca vitripennis]